MHLGFTATRFSCLMQVFPSAFQLSILSLEFAKAKWVDLR